MIKRHYYHQQFLNKQNRSHDLLVNAIEDGWSVKKKNELYIFSKHKGKEKQVYEEKYLERFVQKYFNFN